MARRNRRIGISGQVKAAHGSRRPEDIGATRGRTATLPARGDPSTLHSSEMHPRRDLSSGATHSAVMLGLVTLMAISGASASVAAAAPALAQAQDRRPPVWEQMAESYDRLEAIRLSRPADFGLPVWYDMAQSYEKVEGIRAGH